MSHVLPSGSDVAPISATRDRWTRGDHFPFGFPYARSPAVDLINTSSLMAPVRARHMMQPDLEAYFRTLKSNHGGRQRAAPVTSGQQRAECVCVSVCMNGSSFCVDTGPFVWLQITSSLSTGASPLCHFANNAKWRSQYRRRRHTDIN